ncbi:efflux RND transporter periplasmic adaptor subunit [Vampirovibrio sp.]|uniref:efflux RND transporter periplasmic adaptor subunit n=1 Tax=Vampirovibrio sp. TaxID=2717857 RepID=UPI003594590B
MMPSRNNDSRFRFGKPLITIFALVLLYLLVQWTVKTYQKPNHMGVIESQAMDMTVQPPVGAMPVQTVLVNSELFSGSVTYTGSAVAYNDIAIYPRVEGHIVAMPVYPGDRVKAGQLLAQLDTRELTSKVRESQWGQAAATQQYYASLSQQGQASAQMQRVQKSIQAAKANLQYRQEQNKRSQALVKEAVITQEEAQKDESDFITAQSEYQQALAELKDAERGVSVSQYQSNAQRAQSAQAKAALQTQSIIRGYSRIVSPISGVVTQRMISPGTLVSPGMSILQVAQINPIRIQANVAESDLGQVRIGALITIQNQKSTAKKPITGKVSAIFPRTDLQTRTTVVEAIIPNQQAQFLPGDFVSVSIHTGQASSQLTVPMAALVDRNQQQAVWVVRNGKAHLQYVTTGDRNGSSIAVVDGLKKGEAVIVQGHRDLIEGALVAQGDYGPNGLKALPKVSSGNRLSPHNQYQIKKSVGMYLATIATQSKPPKSGTNTLMVDLASGPGMSMPLNNLGLEVTTLMPSMAKMPVPKPIVQKVGNGRFKVQVDWMMGGLWQVILTVKDGSQVLEKFSVEIEVAD